MGEGFLSIAHQCAPMTEPAELAAIVSIESGFDPLAIRINSDKVLIKQPRSKVEAIEIATSLQIDGQDPDLGLGGLSLQSLNQLGLSIADAFDPCKNLAATGQLLSSYYASARAASNENPKQMALWKFFGRGDPEPGRITGYDELIAQKQATLRSNLNELTLSTGRTPALPARNGNANRPVAMVDEGTDPSLEPEGRDPRQVSAWESATSPAPAKAVSASWDVFSSAAQSQAIIFNRQQE